MFSKTLTCLLLFFTALIVAYPQDEKIIADSLKDHTPKDRTERILEQALEDARQQVQGADEFLLDLEIDELLVNETISKPGNDFFDLFYNQLIWPDVPGDYIVTVTERPFRLTTTQVLIKVNDLEVFNSFLQSRYEYLENLAQYAAVVTQEYITNYNRIIQELEGEDMEGSGIY